MHFKLFAFWFSAKNFVFCLLISKKFFSVKINVSIIILKTTVEIAAEEQIKGIVDKTIDEYSNDQKDQNDKKEKFINFDDFVKILDEV